MEAHFANPAESAMGCDGNRDWDVINRSLHAVYRGREPTGVWLCAGRSQPGIDGLWDTSPPSENQGLIQIQGWFYSKVLHAMLPFVTQHVEPQTVFLGVDEIGELLLQVHVLLIVDRAFKYRILDSLAEVQAFLSHLSQSSLSGFVASGDVICDEDEHGFTLLTNVPDYRSIADATSAPPETISS